MLDELRVCERMIHVLFASSLHGLARAYVKALDHVIWQETEAGSLSDHLKGPRWLSSARRGMS